MYVLFGSGSISNNVLHKFIETYAYKIISLILFIYPYPVYSCHIHLHKLSKKRLVLYKYDIRL